MKELFENLISSWLKKMPHQNDVYVHGVIDGIYLSLVNENPHAVEELNAIRAEQHSYFGYSIITAEHAIKD